MLGAAASALAARLGPISPAARAAAAAPLMTSATIAPSLFPDRFGAKAALTFTIRYAGGETGVPAPVRRSVLRFPAGMSLDIPRLRSCSAALLRARGPRACPGRARLGSGHALLEARGGSQIIKEHVVLHAFLGPPRNLQPIVEILGEGSTPLQERMVLTGTVLPDRSPYSEQLVVPIPPIPTLPYVPDASIVDFSLTVGTRGSRSARAQNSVLVPSTCPNGGFPFAAQFTYADGSGSSALATVPCPR